MSTELKSIDAIRGVPTQIWSLQELGSLPSELACMNTPLVETKEFLTKKINLEGYPLEALLVYGGDGMGGENTRPTRKYIPYPEQTIFKGKLLASGLYQVVELPLEFWLWAEESSVRDLRKKVAYRLILPDRPAQTNLLTVNQNGTTADLRVTRGREGILTLPSTPSLIAPLQIEFP